MIDTWPLPKLKYRPDMPARAYKIMCNGGAYVEVMHNLGIGREAFYDWTDKASPRYKPEFDDAIKQGTIASETWWRERGRNSLNDNSFSPALWYMNMKNRFGWRDTVDVTTQGQAIGFTNVLPRPIDQPQDTPKQLP